MKFSKTINILVTGGNGFLGINFIKKLQSQGYQNVLYPSHAELNILDLDALKKYIEKNNIQIIYHLAARVGGIGANQLYPFVFFYDNMQMGMNIIKCCIDNKYIKKLIMVGSTCSYPATPKTIPFIEEELFSGYPETTNAPYGIAKRSLLTMFNAAKNQYYINGIFLIPTNLYGPYDNFSLDTSHVIPALIRKVHQCILTNSSTLKVWGTGKVTRDFLYVEDCAEALLKSLECDYNGTCPINIGTGIEYNIDFIVKMICSLMNCNSKIEYELNRPEGQLRRCLNIQKSNNILDFRYKTSIREGLIKTIDWYKTNFPKG